MWRQSELRPRALHEAGRRVLSTDASQVWLQRFSCSPSLHPADLRFAKEGEVDQEDELPPFWVEFYC